MRGTGMVRKIVGALLTSALVLGTLLGAGPAQAAKPVENYMLADRCQASWDTKLGAQILKSLNSYRASKGRKAVKSDALLLDWASFSSFEMATKNKFDHHPGFLRFFDDHWELGMGGENVAWRPSKNATAKSFMDGWKKSPGHNANMLDKKWRAVGIALHKSPKTGRVYATATFAENPVLPIPNQLATRACKDFAAKQAAKKKYETTRKNYMAADRAADKVLAALKKQKPGKTTKAGKALAALRTAEKKARPVSVPVSKLKTVKALDKQTRLLKATTKTLKGKTATAKKHLKKPKKKR